MHGLNLPQSARQLFLQHTDNSENTFTGFDNLGNTCFANAVLQVFAHVEALRQWIRNLRPYENDVCDQPKLREVQRQLQWLLNWHSTRT